MDVLTATVPVPVIVLVLAILLGVVVGVLMLAVAIWFLNRVSSKETTSTPSNGRVKGDDSVVAARIAKPVPPPPPLSKKERADLERLLKRQTDIRTTVSSASPAQDRPAGASTVQSPVAVVVDSNEYHKPAPGGATCSLCDSTNVYEHAPIKKAKNSRILHFLTCTDCRKHSTMWTDAE